VVHLSGEDMRVRSASLITRMRLAAKNQSKTIFAEGTTDEAVVHTSQMSD
jgi:hypothetical protein